VILKYAENVVLLPLGAGIMPSANPMFETDNSKAELPLGAGIMPSANPMFETDNSKAEAALLGGKVSFLEDKARQTYEPGDFLIPGTFPYTISLAKSEDLIWAYGWCAAPDKFEQNWEHISFKFYMGDQEVPADQLFKFEFDPESTLKCRYFYNILSEWQAGENHLSTKAVFNQAFNDGTDDFPAGEWIYDYTVFVKP